MFPVINNAFRQLYRPPWRLVSASNALRMCCRAPRRAKLGAPSVPSACWIARSSVAASKASLNLHHFAIAEPVALGKHNPIRLMLRLWASAALLSRMMMRQNGDAMA